MFGSSWDSKKYLLFVSDILEAIKPNKQQKHYQRNKHLTMEDEFSVYTYVYNFI